MTLSMSTDTQKQESGMDKLRTILLIISLTLGIIMGMLSLSQMFVILPYRLAEAEKKIEVLQIGRNADHEILIRIEEQVAEIKRTIVRP